jgi:hypothetical protein
MLDSSNPRAVREFLMRRSIVALVALAVVMVPSTASADDGVILRITTVVHATPGSIVTGGELPLGILASAAFTFALGMWLVRFAGSSRRDRNRRR